MKTQQTFLRLVSLTVATAALALVATSCSTRADQTASVVASASDLYPFDTPADARTFTDAWAQVIVVSEKSGAVEGDGKTEGYRPRIVLLQVQEIYWSRPLSMPIPASFELNAAGFAVHDGKDFPMEVEGAVRMDVGSTYLIGVLNTPDGINMPSLGAALLVINGLVSSQGSNSSGSQIGALMVGKAPKDAVSLVASAKPLVADSIANSDERWRIVQSQDPRWNRAQSG